MPRAAQQMLWTQDPPPVRVRVTPGMTQTLTALGGRVQVDFPAGAVYEEQYSYFTNGNLKHKISVAPTYQDDAYLYDAPVSGCTAGTPATKPNAVRQAGSNIYSYDCNGNMIGRTVGANSYTLSYDAENQLSTVSGAAVASFVSDGDGGRSKAVFGSGDNREIVRYFGNRLETKTLYVEDFENENWVEQSGVWEATGGVYKQSLTTTNTNSYRALAQGAGLEIRWKMTFVSGTQAGLYLMASAGTGNERGNSYRVWQDASYVYIYEAVNNSVGSYKVRFSAPNTVGSSHDYVVRYLTNGRLVVWRDGVNLGGWTDTTPLTTGAYLSLRTDGSKVDFDDIEVSRFKKYYDAGGQRLAMRDANTLSLLFSDHLGSTSLTANASGAEAGRLLYNPWGETRYSSGNTPTSLRFTGQREDASIGLYFYNARYYDPMLGRFIQPDTIVPRPGNPGSLNRYSYVLNNPLRYTDPTGMFTEEEIVNYLGVKTWEEVLKMFDKGGKFAGEWGWLEVLRQAELGDTISLSFGDDSSMFFWDLADVTGSFYEMEGQLMFLGHRGSPQTLIDLHAGLLPLMMKQTGMYQVNKGNFILAPYKTYHLSYDASKVDSTSVGLTIGSATADFGLAAALGSAAAGQPLPALAGAVYWIGGTSAGWVDLGRTIAKWQRGETSRTDLIVDVGTTLVGTIPAAGTPMDVLSLGYELQKGLYMGP